MLHHRVVFAGRHYSEEEEDKKERKTSAVKRCYLICAFALMIRLFIRGGEKKKLRSKSGAFPLCTLLRIMSLGGRKSIILSTRPHVCLRVLCRL